MVYSNIFSRYKRIIYGCIFVLFFGTLAFLFLREPTAKSEVNPYIIVDAKTGENEKEYFVDVKGEVKKPGVYKMKINSRIYQAIENAGGISSEGDTSAINLAQTISDGLIIYIPKKGEKNSSIVEVPIAGVSDTNKKVNLNSATIAELVTLPGIGEKKAKAIVEYRTTNGHFGNIKDIVKIKGLGEKRFKKIENLICIN